jgi:hypothetical protein
MHSDDWNLPTPEEEAAELAAVGLIVEPKDASQEQRDALASYYMRDISAIDAEIERRKRALQIELDLVAQRYRKGFDQLRTRREEREAQVKMLARITEQCGGFGKKAKSRAVGFGRYGHKSTPAKTEIVDADALNAWAEGAAPQLVRVTLQMTLADAKQTLMLDGTGRAITFAALGILDHETKREVLKTPLKEYIDATGEVVPGTREVSATTEYYAEPSPSTEAVS